MWLLSPQHDWAGTNANAHAKNLKGLKGVYAINRYTFMFMPVLPERMPSWSQPSQVLHTAAAWFKPTCTRVSAHGPAGRWPASAVSGGFRTQQSSSHSRIISCRFAQSGFVLRLKVVVLTDSSLEDQKRFGDFCHAHGIQFVVADTKGLCGWVENVENLTEQTWTSKKDRGTRD